MQVKQQLLPTSCSLQSLTAVYCLLCHSLLLRECIWTGFSEKVVKQTFWTRLVISLLSMALRKYVCLFIAEYYSSFILNVNHEEEGNFPVFHLRVQGLLGRRVPFHCIKLYKHLYRTSVLSNLCAVWLSPLRCIW